MTDTERRWIMAALRFGGSFVKSFAQAALNADDDANYAILHPALGALMQKYPKYGTMEVAE